jgi:hypothetical protein
MEATGRVIKRKCLTLQTKQSVHRGFKNIWSRWSKFGEDAVYRMVGEIFAIS